MVCSIEMAEGKDSLRGRQALKFCHIEKTAELSIRLSNRALGTGEVIVFDRGFNA